MNAFEDLGISAYVAKAMGDIGWTAPTPIQTEAVPSGIEGKDILAQAQTGTGKTGAYASIVLTRAAAMSRKPSALILAPTRELAGQIEEEIYKLSRYSGHTSTAVYGGASIEAQIKHIRKGRDIIVGTPGRLKDLLTRNVLDLSHVSIVVLDEADRMLDMGFADELNFIMDCVPKERQTLLFSATMADEIKHLARRYMKDRVDISVSRGEICSDLTEQFYLQASKPKKEMLLDKILSKGCKTIVFCQTKMMTDKLYKNLSGDYSVGVIHGDIQQNKREKAIKKYRDDQITVLIATDVAARGIDVNNIDCVVNYDVPYDVETYLHRIGRTGRAGNKGVAISFVTKPEMQFIRRCEREIGKPIAEVDLEELTFDIKKIEAKPKPVNDRMEERSVERRTEAPVEKKVAEKKKVHIPKVMPQTHGKFPNGMVPLQINLGKADNLNRTQISEFVKKTASLEDASVGRIGLGQTSSFVEISFDHVNAALDALTGQTIKGKKVFISVAPKKTPYKEKNTSSKRSKRSAA